MRLDGKVTEAPKTLSAQATKYIACVIFNNLSSHLMAFVRSEGIVKVIAWR